MNTENSKIGYCGFKNIGNTCYMNSILQLLIHSKLIVNFLISKSNPYKKTYTEKEINNKLELEILYNSKCIKYLKESSLIKFGNMERKRLRLDESEQLMIDKNDIENYMKNTLTFELLEIINTIIYKGSSCITPKNFKHLIDIKMPFLRGMGQQDSHELLNGIFDNLIEETCIDSEPVINNVPESIKYYINFLQDVRNKIQSNISNEEKRKYIQQLNDFKNKNIDVINKFNGLNYMTKVFKDRRITSLNTSSTGHNPLIFNLLTFCVDIIVCIDCKFENCVYQYFTNLVLPIKPKLTECFEEFIKEDLVDRKCEMCNCTQAKKKTIIWKPGMTIFIELCRFINLPNGKLYKNNTIIDIPKNIDLSNYCDKTMWTSENKPSFKYKLRGISNHMGTMNGGHYTADCLSITDDKTWYNFDDSRVSKYENSNINMSNAYILLYEMDMD